MKSLTQADIGKMFLVYNKYSKGGFEFTIRDISNAVTNGMENSWRFIRVLCDDSSFDWVRDIDYIIVQELKNGQ